MVGMIIKEGMIGFKKPGTGIDPSDINKVLGKKTKKDILKDNLIKIGDLD